MADKSQLLGKIPIVYDARGSLIMKYELLPVGFSDLNFKFLHFFFKLTFEFRYFYVFVIKQGNTPEAVE